MLIAAHQMMFGGKRDIFADWYPRWGTDDLMFALNGIYNQGRDLPHDNSATTWVDIVSGLTLARKTTSTNNLKWGANRIELDSAKRAVGANLDLSSVGAATFEVFGDYGNAWGLLMSLSRTSSDSTWTVETHAFASSIGAHININANLPGYFFNTAPSYMTDVVITIDGSGNYKVYFNGNLAGTGYSSTALSVIKNSRLVTVGGLPASVYPPNGSNCYGITIYKAALTEDEVMSLYRANVANYSA